MTDRSQLIRTFAGQPYPFLAERRPVPMYVREPDAGCTPETGLMLLVHYWEGTYDQLFDACDDLANRYNVVAITVNYLQSGKDDQEAIPYDLGLYQTVDCLRALYHVQHTLREEHKPFNPRRLYCAGQSGGGIIALMCAKLAPNSFACIFDLCGCPGLIPRIAFGLEGHCNAHWSQDPASPFYLSPAESEIRDPGHLDHLQRQFEANPKLKYIIVHSQDDTSCPVLDKITIFRNLVATGFRPSAVFVTPAEVDGIAVKTISHELSNTPHLIYRHYGDPFFAPDGRFAAATTAPSDFERRGIVEYPVTGGVWSMDYTDLPTLHFTPAPADN